MSHQKTTGASKKLFSRKIQFFGTHNFLFSENIFSQNYFEKKKSKIFTYQKNVDFEVKFLDFLLKFLNVFQNNFVKTYFLKKESYESKFFEKSKK